MSMSAQKKNRGAAEIGREVLRIEAEAVSALIERLGGAFEGAVDAILGVKGKVVVTGLGKSGIIAKKIAATLASTGTTAVFLHPVEALHGDLGIVGRGDFLVAVSNSGENDEVLNLLASVKSLGVRSLSLTGNVQSALARGTDMTLDVSVAREACPLGLAPTASTTAAMALGDALAVALMEKRGFKKEDFAQFHPGGRLGQRLALRVRDIMRTGSAVPKVRLTQTLGEALQEMTERDNLGVTLVVDEGGALVGVVTDGDLRRIARREGRWEEKVGGKVENFMSRNPKTVDADAAASEAVQIMEVKGITSLAIVDGKGTPVGIIHLHDILGRGKFTV
jgi:arabinose-5-phosphate isomerase